MIVASVGDAPELLCVRDLRVHFPVRSGVLQRTTGVVRAVDGVSFSVGRGETLGLVGESGSGKSTVGRAILRLIPATDGRVEFAGDDLLAASGARLRGLRRRMQIIFQDPAGSLNPRMKIGTIVGEPLRVHGLAPDRDALRGRVRELLARCGMPGADVQDRYPHEFSGGQKQRICIARTLATNPEFIVCDEPTSALAVSIQAQILNLLQDLRRDLKLSLLLISHDMGVVRHMCGRIAVMSGGRIVEMGTADEVIERPKQPCTRKLLAAVPGARRVMGSAGM